jgi:tryptophan-rich sensory protein
MKKSQLFKVVLSLLLPLGVGATAGIFTAGAIPDWYSTLNRPVFNPPNWLFGPVWTVLYLVMGVSLFLVWKEQKSSARNRAIFIFSVHLILNFGWSFLFFYFNSIGLALVEIILLLISIVLMLIKFHKVKPIAAYINIPYLLWVTFATILNAAYFILNS